MRIFGHSPVFLAWAGLGISKIRATGRLPQAGGYSGRKRGSGPDASRPDAFKPLALVQKKGSGKTGASLHQGSYLLDVALRDLAPGLGHLGHEAFPRLEGLLGKFAVESTNLLRLSNKAPISLPCEFGLDLDRLIERPHAHELLDKGPGLLDRPLGVVPVGIRDSPNADREVLLRRGRADGGGTRRGECADREGIR